jgi:hypothetical protein
MIEGSEFDSPQDKAKFLLPKVPSIFSQAHSTRYSLSTVARRMPNWAQGSLTLRTVILGRNLSVRFLSFSSICSSPPDFLLPSDRYAHYCLVFYRSVIPLPSQQFRSLLSLSLSVMLSSSLNPSNSVPLPVQVAQSSWMPCILEIVRSTLSPRTGYSDTVCRESIIISV